MTTRVFGGVFAQAEWSEFVCGWQGLRAAPIEVFDRSGRYRLSLLLYRDSAGRLTPARLTAYSSVTFELPDDADSRQEERQWLSLSRRAAEAVLEEGVKRPLSLAPGLVDLRGFQWAGFRAEHRFTAMVPLPWSMEHVAPDVRRRWAKAETDGFRAGRSARPEDVVACLEATERRKGFRYGVTASTLEAGIAILGEDRFRLYECRSPEGGIAAARVVICTHDGLALEWLAGTHPNHLSTGATQLMSRWMFEDLGANGFSVYDWEGANIPSVAKAKQDWGGELASFSALFPRDLRDVARTVKLGVQARRSRAARSARDPDA